ncbi:MAG: hypothetical protein U0228_26860 [Myxococcaceae bacterium]
MVLRRTLAVLIMLVAAPALAQSAKKPEVLFWEWFAKKEAKLAEKAKTDPAGPMNEISDTLERMVRQGLIAELAVDPAPGKKSTVVISADGDKDLFDAVKAVVAAAPRLKHWDVLAFRQRRDAGDTIEFEDESFTVADFSFREVSRAEGKVDIEIFARGMKSKDDKSYMQAAFIFLDGIVGEYDVETKIGGIQLLPLPAKAPKGLRPLKDLAKVVDSL